jgi:hypothetical protein
MVDNFPSPLIAPCVKIPLHRVEVRKVLRQHPPLATGLGDIEDGIDNISQTGRARPTAGRRRRHVRLDHRPFCIGGVACIA